MEFLINLTIKSTLIILLSILLLKVFQKNTAALRHWVISLTMIGVLGLPLFIVCLPILQVEVPFLAKQTKQVSPNTETIPSKEMRNFENLASLNPSLISSNNTPITQPKVENNNTFTSQNESSSTPIKETSQSFIPLIPLDTLVWVIWIIGVGYFFLKFLLGLYSIWSITRKSQLFSLPATVQATARKITQRRVQFLVSTTIKTPMTWGAFQPVVLLPIAAKNWTIVELNAVILHELSHIKRGDYWIHTLGLLAVCLYWYNPLIWWMKKQQLLEREKACDEAVLRSGVQRQNYAEQLLQITRFLSKPSSMISENALPMAKVSQLKKRIIAILHFEEQHYRFSKWKQWQWGLFYGGLFPLLAAFSPVGQQVLRGHLPLPELETVAQYLDIETEQLSVIMNTGFFSKKEVAISATSLVSEDNNQGMVKGDNQKRNNEVTLPQLLPSLPIALTATTPSPEIKVTTPASKTGLMGQWREGKREFKIWTYGEVKPIDTAPYFDIISPDGFIFIEEYVDGLLSGKVHQLTIAKATQDVVKKTFYWKDLNLSEEKTIKEGELIKVWSNNKSFLFFDKNRDKWIADKVQKIALTLEDKKQQNLIKETNSTDQEWWMKIKNTKEWIEHRFMSKEEAIAQLQKEQRKENFNLKAIPFKQIPFSANPKTFQLLGRKKPVGSNTGNDNTNPTDNKYTTLIKGGQETVLLKDFNFHLSENTFNNLQFELYLYNVADGNIQHSILKKPIPITIAEGTGWIRKDLSIYQVVSRGDILVVLKNIGFSGSKRGKKLYFSLAENYEQYEPILEDGMDWKTKFWENAFIMYFTTEGETSSTSSLPNPTTPTGYYSQWTQGKSDYKLWTYGDFKTYNASPYIEVISENGMVIIEEKRKTLLGTKKYRLAITKAPHDGALVQTFLAGNPNSWTHGVKKGDPLHLWYVDDEWAFLAKGKDTWINETLAHLFVPLEHLTNNDSFQKKTQQDEEWWATIQQYQEIIAKRYIDDPVEMEKLENLKQAKILPSEIPFKAIPKINLKGQSKKIGRLKATGTTSGSSGYKDMRGHKYGTILKNSNQKGILQSLHFNIQRHQFETLDLDVYFFKVKNGNIQHALTEQPVRMTINKKEKGWIKRNLAAHQIGVQGDVLVVMEIADYTARQTSLFFALAPTHFMYKPTDLFFEGKKLEFWDSAFAWYGVVKK